MRNYLAIALTTALMAFCLCAAAAKPTSITFESDNKTIDGIEYANFIVKCSNGEKQLMTTWNNRKKWCVGRDSFNNCNQKQIKAAMKACETQANEH